MILFLLCTAALLTIADKSGLAWLSVRAAVFLALALAALGRRGSSRWDQQLPSLAVALALLSAGGYPALDYSLAALCFGAFAAYVPTRRSWWAIAAIAVGCLGAVSFFAHTVLPAKLFPPEFPVLFPFHNRNHYAIFAEIFLPLLVWKARKSSLLPYAVGAVILLAASLAGGSRAGILLLALECLVLAWRLGGAKMLLPGAVAALALLSVFVLLSDSARIQSPLEGDHRLEIWQSSVEMIAARPLSGWGLYEFGHIYPSYARFDNGQSVLNAHSDWLEWAAELGLPAPAFVALLLILYWRKVQRQPWAWGILFGALHALVDFGWHLPGLMLFTVAFAGAAASHVQESTNP